MKISCLFFVSTNFNTRFIKLSCLTLCKKNSIQININENFNINKFKLIFSNFSFFQFSKIKYFLNEIRILFRENSIFFFFFFIKCPSFSISHLSRFGSRLIFRRWSCEFVLIASGTIVRSKRTDLRECDSHRFNAPL